MPPVAGRGVGTKKKGGGRFTVLALTIGVAQVLCAGCGCTVDAGVRVCDRVVRMAYLRLFE